MHKYTGRTGEAAPDLNKLPPAGSRAPGRTVGALLFKVPEKYLEREKLYDIFTIQTICSVVKNRRKALKYQ